MKKTFIFKKNQEKKETDEQRGWQKKRGEKLTPKYNPKYYRTLYLMGDWFRALEVQEFNNKKRELVYGQLESARSYVWIAILEKLQEEIEKKYPYILARPYNQPLFTPTGDKGYSTMADMDKRAAGKEKELAKAEKRLRKITDKIERFVITSVEPYSEYTFRQYDESENGTGIDYFIIGGLKAAENMNFKTFFYDFYERRQPFEVLDNIVEKGVKKYKKRLFK